jgi:hypothetical protein
LEKKGGVKELILTPKQRKQWGRRVKLGIELLTAFAGLWAAFHKL